MIAESNIDRGALSFLRRKIPDSMQDLAVFYLLMHEQDRHGRASKLRSYRLTARSKLFSDERK